MRTLLIPVDFSETSANALEYAVELIKDIKVDRIVLLKTFYKSVYEQILPTADFVQLSEEDIQAERLEVNKHLNSLTRRLLSKCDPSVTIERSISELPLLRSIHQLIAEIKPDLLIVGGDDPSSQQESYIGQYIVSIARTSPVPVLIVPACTKYQKIERALVPCDFAMVSRLSILKSLHSPLDWLHPELFILNIDPKQKHISHEEEHAEMLKGLLEGYKYQIHYAEDKNTVKGILKFARSNDVQLVTALPGKYSFFYKVTHNSTTEALAANACEPILILK